MSIIDIYVMYQLCYFILLSITGWITFGIIGLILAMLLALFPKQLPRTAARRIQQKQTLPEIKRSFAGNVLY